MENLRGEGCSPSKDYTDLITASLAPS